MQIQMFLVSLYSDKEQCASRYCCCLLWPSQHGSSNVMPEYFIRLLKEFNLLQGCEGDIDRVL